MSEIEILRKNVKLNLCEECFKKYLAIIEPSIEKFVSKPLYDIRLTESNITWLVMEAEGVYKGDMRVISFNKEETKIASELIDIEAFRRIEIMSFKRKIKYLYDKGIIKDSAYRVLDEARKARNKIHQVAYLVSFSKEDYELFSLANLISQQIGMACKGFLPEIAERFKSQAEEIAKKWLQMHKLDM